VQAWHAFVFNLVIALGLILSGVLIRLSRLTRKLYRRKTGLSIIYLTPK